MSGEKDGDVSGEATLGPSDDAPAPPAAEAPLDGPIVDPLAAAEPTGEAGRVALDAMAQRARWLSAGSFVAGGAGVAVAALGIAGRVDIGALLYLLPMAVVNVVLGVLLRRAAVPLQLLSKSIEDRRALTDASAELTKVFTVQLVATSFFVALVAMSLLSALLVKSVTEL